MCTEGSEDPEDTGVCKYLVVGNEVNLGRGGALAVAGTGPALPSLWGSGETFAIGSANLMVEAGLEIFSTLTVVGTTLLVGFLEILKGGAAFVFSCCY